MAGAGCLLDTTHDLHLADAIILFALKISDSSDGTIDEDQIKAGTYGTTDRLYPRFRLLSA